MACVLFVNACVLRWECFFVFLLFDVFVVAINMDSFRRLRHHHYYNHLFVVRSLNIIFLPFPIVIRRRNFTLPSQLICIFCGLCMKSDSVLTPQNTINIQNSLELSVSCSLNTIQCHMIFLEFLYYAKLNFYLIWIPLLYCIHCKFDSYGYGSSLTWFVCLYISLNYHKLFDIRFIV